MAWLFFSKINSPKKYFKWGSIVIPVKSYYDFAKIKHTMRDRMKTSQKFLLMVPIAIAFLFLATAMSTPVSAISANGTATTSSAQIPSMRDDAFQYPSVASQVDSSAYIENWYFSLTDTKYNMSFWCQYEVNNPGNSGSAGLYPDVAYANGNLQIGSNVITSPAPAYTSWSASASKLNVNINNGGFSAVAFSVNLIHITGSDLSCNISWNLFYTREIAQSPVVQNAPLGFLPQDNQSWIDYMPMASVSGIIAVSGHSYTITSAPGYHDHNWGEQYSFYFNPWMKFNTVVGGHSIFIGAIAMPDPTKLNPRNLLGSISTVNIDGTWIKDATLTSLQYTSFGIDPATGSPYISSYAATIIAGNYVIKFTAMNNMPFFYIYYEENGIALYFQQAFGYTFSGSVTTTPSHGSHSIGSFSCNGEVEQVMITAV